MSRPWWRRTSPVAADERGSMAVEVVLLTPILVMFTLLVVAGGRYVSVQADIDAAARDAARAATYERSYPEARAAAVAAANAALDDFTDCNVPAVPSGQFYAGGVVTVELDCQVSHRGLGLIGLNGSFGMTADASAPLDTYRRTE